MNYIRQLFQLETLVCRVEKFCPGTSIKLFPFALIHMINHNNLSVCGPRYLVFTQSQTKEKSMINLCFAINTFDAMEIHK